MKPLPTFEEIQAMTSEQADAVIARLTEAERLQILAGSRYAGWTEADAIQDLHRILDELIALTDSLPDRDK